MHILKSMYSTIYNDFKKIRGLSINGKVLLQMDVSFDTIIILRRIISKNALTREWLEHKLWLFLCEDKYLLHVTFNIVIQLFLVMAVMAYNQF